MFEHKTDETAAPAPPKPQRRLALWAGGGGLGALLLLVAANAYLAKHQTVYVVSGYAKPVTVEIAGQAPLTLTAGQPQTLTLPEGRHEAVVRGPGESQVVFELKPGFRGRWFQSPLYVLNAGGSALLLEENVHHAARRAAGGQSQWRLFFGQTFLSWPQVDYAFAPFPDNLQTSEGSKDLERVRVDFVKADPVNLFYTMVGNQRPEEAMSLAEWQLRLNPEEPSLLPAYIAVAENASQVERAKAFFQEATARRPVEIEWHRNYQELMASQANLAMILVEYDQLLEKEPANSALCYLRGRICPRQSEAVSHYQRAIRLDTNNAFAHYALGHTHAYRGDWAGGLASFARAVALQPMILNFRNTLFDARLACGDYAALEREGREAVARMPSDYHLNLQLGDVLAAQGKKAEALEVCQAFEQVVTRQYGPQGKPAILELRLRVLYSLGDFAALEQAAASEPSLPGRNGHFQALVELGKLKEAEEVFPLENPALTDPFHFLFLSVAWKESGDAARAEQYRARALDLLGRGRAEHRRLWRMFTEAVRVGAADVLDLTIPPKPKAVALLALAQQFPQDAAEYQDAVRKLNTDRAYPYHGMRRRAGGL